MKVLFIGGSGIISTASTWLAAERGIELTLLRRGQHAARMPLRQPVFRVAATGASAHLTQADRGPIVARESQEPIARA